jgi:hypothetical protein
MNKKEWEGKVIEHLLGMPTITAPPRVYMRLLDKYGPIEEAVEIPPAANGKIEFPIKTPGGVRIVGYAVYDAPTGGNLLWSERFPQTAPKLTWW